MTETLASPNCDVSKLADGEEIVCCDGYCDLCNWAFGGSMTQRRAIHLQGKFYHPSCYPTAVNAYLATKRLKKERS